VAPPHPPTARSHSGRLPTLALAAGLVAADQISKEWVLHHLPLGVPQPFLPGLLALQYVRNTGAAFSLLSGNPHLLGLVSVVVSGGLVGWILLRPPQGPWRNLALAFLLGGAAGNGIDRFRHGAVTDFLALVPVSFPVFNLADVAINVAVACLLLDAFLPRGGTRKPGPGPRRHG
jgi:signal peptidase II